MTKESLIIGLIVIAIGMFIGQAFHEPFAAFIVVLGFGLAYQPALRKLVYPDES